MPQIMPIKDLKDTSSISESRSMYSDIQLSEQQIKDGKTKNARKALSAVREKYDL